MNELQSEHGARQMSGHASEQTVGQLLRLAGPRPQVPRERAERVKAMVYERWQREVEARRQARRFSWRSWTVWAAAAAMTVGLGLVFWRTLMVPGVVSQLAVVETVEGVVTVIQEGRLEVAAGESALAVGDAVARGTVLKTGDDGRVALRVAGGASLRLDRKTQLRLSSAAMIDLHQGAVYVDSGAKLGETTPIQVRTDKGVATEIGTQFEVRRENGSLRLRVRSGAVQYEGDNRTHETLAGSELRVEADGTWKLGEVRVFGPEWQWTLAIAPAFELEGASLDVFLDWVSRETAWQVRFAEPSTALSSPEIFLHGSLDGLTPDQAPAAVLPTCGLEHRVTDGVMIVEASPRNP